MPSEGLFLRLHSLDSRDNYVVSRDLSIELRKTSEFFQCLFALYQIGWNSREKVERGSYSLLIEDVTQEQEGVNGEDYRLMALAKRSNIVDQTF